MPPAGEERRRTGIFVDAEGGPAQNEKYDRPECPEEQQNASGAFDVKEAACGFIPS